MINNPIHNRNHNSANYLSIVRHRSKSCIWQRLQFCPRYLIYNHNHTFAHFNNHNNAQHNAHKEDSRPQEMPSLRPQRHHKQTTNRPERRHKQSTKRPQRDPKQTTMIHSRQRLSNFHQESALEREQKKVFFFSMKGRLSFTFISSPRPQCYVNFSSFCHLLLFYY